MWSLSGFGLYGKSLKVFTFPMLLGNNTMFVCECPFVTGSISGCVYDVFHASLISDFPVEGFHGPDLHSL